MFFLIHFSFQARLRAEMVWKRKISILEYVNSKTLIEYADLEPIYDVVERLMGEFTFFLNICYFEIRKSKIFANSHETA